MEGYFLKPINQDKAREDILEASHNLADYLYQEKIRSVMFLDNSARQAYVGLKEIWKKDYGAEPEPNIYFINARPISFRDDFPELAEEFAEKYKNLDKNQPILLYDVCAHSGQTTSNVRDFFKYLGFNDVRIAITSVSSDFPEEKKAELDLVCLPRRAQLGCHPFGQPTYVKTSGSLVSKINQKKYSQAVVRNEHKKIKEVF